MLAAGIALVAARVRLGRFGALYTVAFFLAIRGGLALIVGPIIGNTTPHLPLYIVEAIIVELVALRVSDAGRTRSGCGRASGSAPSASRPSGPGRMRGSPTRGPRRCSPRAPSWASSPQSPAACSAGS